MIFWSISWEDWSHRTDWMGMKTPCLGAHSGSLKKTSVALSHNLGAPGARAPVRQQPWWGRAKWRHKFFAERMCDANVRITLNFNPGLVSIGVKLEPVIWSCDIGQQIPCFDRYMYQLTITWMSNSKYIWCGAVISSRQPVIIAGYSEENHRLLHSRNDTESIDPEQVWPADSYPW